MKKTAFTGFLLEENGSISLSVDPVDADTVEEILAAFQKSNRIGKSFQVLDRKSWSISEPIIVLSS